MTYDGLRRRLLRLGRGEVREHKVREGAAAIFAGEEPPPNLTPREQEMAASLVAFAQAAQESQEGNPDPACMEDRADGDDEDEESAS